MQAYVNSFNLGLLLAWVVLLALALYIASVTQTEAEPFDPFEILNIDKSATVKEIKRAYRDLAKIYHPDKKPGPEAEKYFAEKIAKAHQTLTDEVSRENWLKHGHPDGPQAMTIGVALLPFFFTSDRRTAPLVLLGLAFFGLAVPILSISVYLWQSEGFVGANKVSESTLMYYHRFGVKEMLRLTKMPEAMVPAQEFTAMPLKRETGPVFTKFLNSMKRSYDVSSVPKWWTPEMMRTYLFMLVFFDRRLDLLPTEFQADFKESLRWLDILCTEFVKAAVASRNRMMRGWFVPAESAVQLQQCLVQQVKLEVRSPSVEDRKKKKAVNGEAAAALLQLSGVDEDVIRNLEKNHKLKSLEELAVLSEEARGTMLTSCGVPANHLPDVENTLLALPDLHVTAVKCFVEDEEDMKEQDVVTIQVFVALTRRAHATWEAGVVKGKDSVAAYAPRFPHPVNEKWHIFLTNQKAATPSTWSYQTMDFMEAEAAGAENLDTLGCKWRMPQVAGHLTDSAGSSSGVATNGETAANGSKAAEATPIGKKIEFKFLLHEPGKFNLTFVAMPSTWIGCDVTAPVTLNVLKQTAAEKAGKAPPRGPKAVPLDDDEIDKKEDADADSDEESDEDDADADSEGWDTDETGTAVTHMSDTEDGEPETKATEESKKSK